MSAGRKRYRAVVPIPEISQVVLEDDSEYAQDMIDFHCNCDCYYFDCGLDCPKDCPILRYHTLQEQQEQEVLDSLGI